MANYLVAGAYGSPQDDGEWVVRRLRNDMESCAFISPAKSVVIAMRVPTEAMNEGVVHPNLNTLLTVMAEFVKANGSAGDAWIWSSAGEEFYGLVIPHVETMDYFVSCRIARPDGSHVDITEFDRSLCETDPFESAVVQLLALRGTPQNPTRVGLGRIVTSSAGDYFVLFVGGASDPGEELIVRGPFRVLRPYEVEKVKACKLNEELRRWSKRDYAEIAKGMIRSASMPADDVDTAGYFLEVQESES